MTAPRWTLLEKIRVVVEANRLGPERLAAFLLKEQLTQAEYEAFEKETEHAFARARKKGVRCW